MKRHSQNTLDVIYAAFPKTLNDDVLEVMKRIPVTDIEPHTKYAYRVRLAEGGIKIPTRVYFPEIAPNGHEDLSDPQRAILAAIFTRHHSGYQREIWVEQLMKYPNPWAAPFIASLLGEYVVEILILLERSVDDSWESLIYDFAALNPEWTRPLNHQILSYWTAYHRPKIPRLLDYPGYRLAVKWGLWNNKTAPKIIRAEKAYQPSS